MGRGVTPGPLLPVNVVAETIGRSGSSEQQELLASVLAGEVILGRCFNEPDGNWTPESIAGTAVADGDSYVISGRKTAAEAAGQVHHLLVTARGDGELTQFLLSADTAGMTITQQSGLNIARRFALVEFDGVEVGADALVGPAGGAAADVERQRQMATMLPGATMRDERELSAPRSGNPWDAIEEDDDRASKNRELQQKLYAGGFAGACYPEGVRRAGTPHRVSAGHRRRFRRF